MIDFQGSNATRGCSESPGERDAVRQGFKARKTLRRIGSWAQTGWSIVGITLLLLLFLESFLSWYRPRKLEDEHKMRGEFFRQALAPESMDWADELVAELKPTVAGPERWEWFPQSYWRSRPFSGKHIGIDEHGLRNTWAAPDTATRPKVACNLYVFGGSTVWGYGARDDQTIPSALARGLEELELPSHVTNYGQLAYVSSQEVATLMHEVQCGRVPDVALFVSGFNDIIAASVYGMPGLTIDETGRYRDFRITNRSPDELFLLGLRASAIVRTFSPDYSVETLRFPPAAYRQLASAAELPLEERLRRGAHFYHENLRLAVALGKEYDFEVLFCIQPVLFEKHTDLLSDWEKSRASVPLRSPMLQGYELLRRVPIADLAKRQIYLGNMFSSPAWKHRTAYYDVCHLVEAANTECGDRLAREVARVWRQRHRADP